MLFFFLKIPFERMRFLSFQDVWLIGFFLSSFILSCLKFECFYLNQSYAFENEDRSAVLLENKAIEAWMAKQTWEEVVQISQLLETHPQKLDALTPMEQFRRIEWWADACFQLGNRNEAHKIFQNFSTHKSFQTEFFQKEFEKKRLIYSTAFLKNDAQKYYHESLILFGSGKISSAIEKMKLSFRMEPGLLEVQFKLGQLYFLDGQWSKAMDCFREILKNYADFPNGNLWMARAQFKLKDIPGAVESYKKAWKQSLVHPQFRNEFLTTEYAKSLEAHQEMNKAALIVDQDLFNHPDHLISQLLLIRLELLHKVKTNQKSGMKQVELHQHLQKIKESLPSYLSSLSKEVAILKEGQILLLPNKTEIEHLWNETLTLLQNAL